MSIRSDLEKGTKPLTELDEKPESATRAQLNNVDLVRVPYLTELVKLPELERGMEMVKLLVFVMNHSKGTKLEEKINLAMRAMSST